MNGVKHDMTAAAPTPPPKQSSSSMKSDSAGATASSISEKALPPIQGALHSAKQNAKDLIDTSSFNTSASTEYPIPQSHPDSQIADYVLVFQHIAKKYLRASAKVPASERTKVAAEYEALIQRIKSTGLRVTSRDGAKGSGQILIFVKADMQLLHRLARQEALSDYLHGVLSVQPPPPRSSSLQQGNTTATSLQSQTSSLHLTPASRLRLVDSLLTLPNLASHAVKDASGKSQVPSGAGLRVGLSEFPHLIDMSAIHDPLYNSAWMKRLSHTSPAKAFFGVGLEDLDSIREHFGEDVALYFGFLNFYFQALAPAALLGVSFWLLGRPFSPVYSLGLVTWSCLFVELWRMKERKLAVRWGTLGVSQVDRRRHDFAPRTTRIDPATEEPEEVFEWWRRELRVILSLPIVAFFASVLAATMTLMFVVEIFVTQLYHGPLKVAVPFIPTALLVVAVPQIMAAWQATAVAITKWENHYSAKSYDFSLTLKRFAMQAITAYGALTLSAYVYIPFGEWIMQTMVERGFFQDSIQEAIKQGHISPKGIDFHINPDRMHTQLFAVSVTSQFVNAFTELALPVLMRKFAEWREERAEKKKTSGSDPTRKVSADSSSSSSSSGDVTPLTGSASSESERRFVSRVRKELQLPPYDLFGDYAEMATQFGYITLWSVVWPLSPVMGFVNNFFELRSDAAKISVNNRRPIPLRAETIGPWLEAFGFIAWLSALNNAALVYLFQQSDEALLDGHSRYESTMRTHIHPHVQGGDVKVMAGGATHSQSWLSFSRLLPNHIPTSGPAGAIVAAILVALLAEHVYGVMRSGVRHILERLIWRGSQEEMIVRRREWVLRVETLKSRVEGEKGDEITVGADVEKMQGGEAEEGFWSSQKDVGSSAILSSGKTE
ncbi:related to IST2 - Plasma membrane protein that may be involved in osmotolerance [Ustilago trichophora]|uniref:Related to IST2 - Plasma membrane protein that may be involved in osmotolerance n=1 Tax=Ustilago trichophora TaxID=86804 RepID=A0A5C3EH39_9BASI|nr:related to IST2 - Plasma membrane protein that may be involved in osmotolerance [Ustilago trichophora]